jgi:hypothetical protein
MGCDWGVRIVKVNVIIENWIAIKNNLIGGMIFRGVSDAEMHEKTKKLPDDIAGYDAQMIVTIFDYLKHCDCPCNLDGKYIVFSEGDNCPDYVRALASAMSNVKSSFYIETWT